MLVGKSLVKRRCNSILILVLKGQSRFLIDLLKTRNILHIVLSGRGLGGFALTESSK